MSTYQEQIQNYTDTKDKFILNYYGDNFYYNYYLHGKENKF